MPIPKPDEISPGTFQIGSYTFLINRCPFDTLPEDQADFFMVMLAIREDNGYLWNIDLVSDPRFQHFAHLSTFERKLTNDDLVEYNHHVGSVFHRYHCPTYKLSRHSISKIWDICQPNKKPKRNR